MADFGFNCKFSKVSEHESSRHLFSNQMFKKMSFTPLLLLQCFETCKVDGLKVDDSAKPDRGV